MDETPWSVLGIEPTTDERSIKRAYAAKLKVTSPEKDPTGYMQLRAAYEGAKQHAAYQQYLSRVEEVQRAQQESASPPATEPSAAVAPAEPATKSPQQSAFEELHALLETKQLEPFLTRLEAIKTSNLFATLDQQYYFVGEVAGLIQQLEAGDSNWRGRVAEVLGAREHENMFDGDGRYWYAYAALLKDYSALRAARAQAHVDGHGDEIAPGYLHVYHVLTSPFDAERLSALTRSQGYSRIAQSILGRAKTDASIAIPTENREWWERTAMAGQHRPTAEPIPEAVAAQTQPESAGRFPFWVFWILLILVVQIGRACSGPSTSRITLTEEQMERFRAETPLTLQREPSSSSDVSQGRFASDLDRRLALCDSQTRSAIIAHLSISRSNARFARATADDQSLLTSEPASSLVDDDVDSSRIDERDPILMSLLSKCDAGRYFDDDGWLKELPRAR